MLKIQQMQQFADIYLLQSHSTCLGVSQRTSTGVLKTVTGKVHNMGTATFLHRVPDHATLEGSSCTDFMTCTGYSF